MSCSVAVSNSNVFSLSSPCHFSLPSPVLKRHRPAKLHIPVASLTVEVLPPVPSPTPAKDVVEVEGIGFSVYCKKGIRKQMEDRYSASVNLHGESKQAFFGVFDGHGGTKASEFAAHNLEKNVLEVIKSDYESDIEEAVRNGYLKTDSDFLKEELNGGSCCVTTLIRNGNLIVSNAGDCRAVISRGEPETKVVKIESHHDLLILASDGLWEKVSNQEAVDIARSFCVGSNTQGSFKACKKLVDLSASRGSIDDISIMIIELQNYI
ncbi:hypothetical protein TSUD_126330 [Trifolium subterraneum]|uniref:protein-serine/threonine phosphatase n=1 Tax=Trifolium subterraneum TaxID=3900 RepID=A0A2Z6NE08_TRISU|nr:hypothetical protein TSUD_126330 [Trifolium subterraneum]